jgi:hypothetical protein
MNEGEERQGRTGLWLALFSGAGIAACGLAVLAFGLITVSDYIRGQSDTGFLGIWTTVGFGLLGVVGIPAFRLGLQRFMGDKAARSRRPSGHWLLVVVLFPVGLGLGYWIFGPSSGPRSLGLLANLVTIGSPVLFAAVLVQRLGVNISSSRAWTHFLLGAWMIPFLAFFLELLAVLLGLIGVAFGLNATSTGRAALLRLGSNPSEWLSGPHPDVLHLLGGQPWILVVALGFLTLFIPLIEEALKSISSWPTLRAWRSGSEAFVGGALGGFGFALSEALFLTQPDSSWVTTALSRGGATMMHGFGAALTAWGLAEALIHRKWWRLPVAYLTAAFLHGLWNLGAASLGIAELAAEPGFPAMSPETVDRLVIAGVSVIIGLSLLATTGLPVISRYLAAQSRKAAPEGQITQEEPG